MMYISQNASYYSMLCAGVSWGGKIPEMQICRYAKGIAGGSMQAGSDNVEISGDYAAAVLRNMFLQYCKNMFAFSINEKMKGQGCLPACCEARQSSSYSQGIGARDASLSLCGVLSTGLMNSMNRCCRRSASSRLPLLRRISMTHSAVQSPDSFWFFLRL